MGYNKNYKPRSSSNERYKGTKSGPRDINSRIGKPRRPLPIQTKKKADLTISKNRPAVEIKKTLDPSQIIITKKITPQKPSSAVIPRIDNSNKRSLKPATVVRKVVPEKTIKHEPPETDNGYSSKKKIVLIANLDPRVSAEDVGEACSMFGPILSCDLLLDPMGRPLNEAEIEFVHPDSAKECVAKLDNSFTDGRILRAKLQSSPTLPVKPRYSSRTVNASTRVTSEGFDQPRMINQHTPQVLQPPRHYPYYQQYQHQFYKRY